MIYLAIFTESFLGSSSANALNTNILHESFCAETKNSSNFHYLGLFGVHDLTFCSFFDSAVSSPKYLFPIPFNQSFPGLRFLRRYVWRLYSSAVLICFFLLRRFFGVLIAIHTRDLFVAKIASLLRLNTNIELHRIDKEELSFFGFCQKNSHFLADCLSISCLTPMIQSDLPRNIFDVFTNTCFEPVHKELPVASSLINFDDWSTILFLGGKVSSEGSVILYLGHPHSDRGVLECASALQNNNSVSLIVLGVNSTSLSNLRSKFSESKNIFFAPSVPREIIAQYLSSVDALLIPYSSSLKTLKYAYPTKATEYMSTNLPIFSSNLPILVHCFQERALYFESDDYNSFVKLVNSYFGVECHPSWPKRRFPGWEYRVQQIVSNFIFTSSN